MDVLPYRALDMSGSLYQTIGYLLNGKWEDLESKPYNWISNMRGQWLILHMHDIYWVDAS